MSVIMGIQKKYRSLSELNELLPERQRTDARPVVSKQTHDGKGKTVHLRLETKGRKGKMVTVISGLHHNPAAMEDIARIMKQHCGAGGTVKGAEIEIQGDQRERLAAKLRELNYEVTE